jgi:hypothetical protein
MLTKALNYTPSLARPIHSTFITHLFLYNLNLNDLNDVLHSSVSITPGYWLDFRSSIKEPLSCNRRPPNITYVGSSHTGMNKTFLCLCHSVQTDSEDRPASYRMAIRDYFSGSKAVGACSWPLKYVKNGGAIDQPFVMEVSGQLHVMETYWRVEA